MKLFFKYFMFTIQQATKDPRKALKVLPGLGFLLIGLVYMTCVFVFFSSSNTSFSESMMYNGIIYACAIASFFYLFLIVQGITGGPLGFRSADANLLMVAPITKFQAYMFVLVKSYLMYIGISFFITATQSYGILLLTNSRLIIISTVLSLLLSLFTIGMLGYISVYFRIKNEIITKIASTILLVFIVGTGYMLYQKYGNSFVVIDWLHYVPFIGWNLGIAYHATMNNYMMMAVYYTLEIVGLIILYMIARSLKFDYYEYELSKVAKTDKAYQRMQGKKQEDIKFFKKSGHQIKNMDEKIIIDLAKIRAGKFWMISLINIISVVLTVFFIFTFNNMLYGKLSSIYTTVFLIIGVSLYLGTFTFVDSGIYTDFYLKLIPIQSLYKIIYYHYTKILNVFLKSIIYTISVVILHFTLEISLQYAVYTFVLSTLFGISEVLRLENVSVYLVNKVGKTLTVLIGLIQALISVVLIFGVGILLLTLTNNEMIVVIYLSILSCVYSAIWLMLGKKIYDNTDISEYSSN